MFQLVSHKSLYESTNKDVPKTVMYPPRLSRQEKKAEKAGTWVRPPEAPTAELDVEANNAEDENENPEMSLTMTIILLAVVTAVCSFVHVDKQGQ